MYQELLTLWKTKRRVLEKWDDPMLIGVKYQLDRCIFDLENELGVTALDAAPRKLRDIDG